MKSGFLEAKRSVILTSDSILDFACFLKKRKPSFQNAATGKPYAGHFSARILDLSSVALAAFVLSKSYPRRVCQQGHYVGNFTATCLFWQAFESRQTTQGIAKESLFLLVGQLCPERIGRSVGPSYPRFSKPAIHCRNESAH